MFTSRERIGQETRLRQGYGGQARSCPTDYGPDDECSTGGGGCRAGAVAGGAGKREVGARMPLVREKAAMLCMAAPSTSLRAGLQPRLRPFDKIRVNSTLAKQRKARVERVASGGDAPAAHGRPTERGTAGGHAPTLAATCPPYTRGAARRAWAGAPHRKPLKGGFLPLIQNIRRKNV